MKKFICILGYFIVCLSIAFLFRKISLYGLSITKYPDKTKLFVVSFLAGLCYAFICPLSVIPWYYFLKFTDKNANFSSTYLIYSRSQIAKYLPGNVFHYAGRQAMGHIAGLKQSSIFMATVIETILIIIVAVAIAICGVLVLGFAKEKLNFLIGAEVAFIVCAVFSIILLPKIAQHFSFLRKILGEFATLDLKQWFKVVSLPLLLYTVSFILLGILLWMVAVLCFKIETSWRTFLAFPTVFATAWVLGFITPGAPGGIGVREAILTAGLSPFIGTSTAVSISIVARIIAILGDVFFYLSSYVVPKFLTEKR
ncbi:lysylphosphatidylglycerol synthase domain-containing protein [Desulfonauticus submarinus]